MKRIERREKKHAGRGTKERPARSTVELDSILRAPYATLRAPDYEPCPKLEHFQRETLGKEVQRLLKKAKPDILNGDTFDYLIASYIEEARQEILRQHTEHERVIDKLVARHKGDLVDAAMKIEDFEKHLAQLEQDIGRYEQMQREAGGRGA